MSHYNQANNAKWERACDYADALTPEKCLSYLKDNCPEAYERLSNELRLAVTEVFYEEIS